MIEVFKVVQLLDGDLTSVLVPRSSAVSYGTVKGKKKKVKECSAFRLREDAEKFMSDWTPFRELQLWKAEAETAEPSNPKNDDSRIYECTNLTLIERLEV